jgi:hypothetical protein
MFLGRLRTVANKESSLKHQIQCLIIPITSEIANEALQRVVKGFVGYNALIHREPVVLEGSRHCWPHLKLHCMR